MVVNRVNGIETLMDLIDIIHRALPPVPWTEGEKIPWNEPGFSHRMLEMKAYTHQQVEAMLSNAGFQTVQRPPNWGVPQDPFQDKLQVFTATKG